MISTHNPRDRFRPLWICIVFLLGTSLPAIGQWVRADNGLTNRNVDAFASIGTTLVAGTSGGGVFISTDGGAAWVDRSNGLTIVDVRSLATVGTGIFAGTAGGGVFFSSDFGVTWQERNFGLTPVTVYALVASGGTLFAGTADGGVFRSSDAGAHWTPVNNGLGTVTVFSLAVSGADLFAGIPTPPGLARMPLADTTWTTVPIGVAAPDVVVSLAFTGSTIFAGTTTHGIRRSTNSGSNWQSVNNGFTIAQVNCMLPFSTSTFAGMNINGVYQTIDNGGNWSTVSSGLPTFMNVNALLVSGTSLYAGGIGYGVYRRPLSQLVSVSEGIHVPTMVTLYDAYPNPFNPETRIGYSLTDKEQVTLTVFDALGREVAALVNEIQDAGFKSVQFDARGLASGMYFYQLRTGAFVSTKRFLLLR